MFAAASLAYSQTNAFTKIVTDYLEGKDELKPFFAFASSLDGIKHAIEQRQQRQPDRQLLVRVLDEQYRTVESCDSTAANIAALNDAKTFTVCTAHQPNLFTGPLYFVYKILHAITLSDYLNEQLKGYRFVPVFYMGCEDADLEELNHFTVEGKKYTWNTRQTGAVGRMKIDKELIGLIDELERQLSVLPYGDKWIMLLRKCYKEGRDIQTATFELVHLLFGPKGLIVLIPDHPGLKTAMEPVFEDDIFNQQPLKIVSSTSQRLSKIYNVQAHARGINLFYLRDNVRERIEKKASGSYVVLNTKYSFTEPELKEELRQHPERFSPNVILRGLFQETILPNIAFIGGGGELAYWLQLKDLFDHYEVFFPVQVLRNSFLIIDKAEEELIKKLKLHIDDIFLEEQPVLNRIIEREGKKPQLNGEVEEFKTLYRHLGDLASSHDPTLKAHVDALKTKTINSLLNLEKKMLRAERKKYEAQQRQIAKLRRQLFPGNGLQERVENIGGFYARWGAAVIEAVRESSSALDQQFTILRQND